MKPSKWERTIKMKTLMRENMQINSTINRMKRWKDHQRQHEIQATIICFYKNKSIIHRVHMVRMMVKLTWIRVLGMSIMTYHQ
jgi:hypothetical protein